MPNFALEGQKWGGPAFGTSGGTVSWAVDGSVPASFVSQFRAAFADWARYGNIAFVEVASTASSDIDLGFRRLDGPDGVLGRASYAFSGASLLSATVAFDSSEDWSVSGDDVVSRRGTELFTVALHEIGHAIGLDHYDAVPAIMNSLAGRGVADLTASDIEGVRAIYGAAPGGGSASLRGLVDASFYRVNYPEVAAAGIDPDQHYHDTGWRQGLNPNAFFSTSSYLAANPDIRAAGVDPLRHFDQIGWREGRDPSASFDVTLYLHRNTDVAAAGIDPLLHFLQYGEAEGRTAYRAVGRNVASDGFDAEFYLLANPDVARNGIDARAHYEAAGWREGRDANILFDSDGYLAAHPDVAAAGISPLFHYSAFGWREGREPSTGFDTSSYLAAHPDVAAAGIDPLLHYLRAGIYEGRSAFGDGFFG